MSLSPLNARRALLLGLGASVAGAGLIWRSWRRSGAQPAGAVPPQGAATRVDDSQPVPEFTLRSPAGPVTRASLMGHWSVVFFGYTQCPDICPTSLGLMAEVSRQLAPAQRPRVLFVSVDPARDTVELLGQYVPAFNPDFVGAGGSDEALAALVKHLGVRYERHPAGPSGEYTVDHTASLFLIDPQARLKAVFSPPHDASAILADLRRLTA